MSRHTAATESGGSLALRGRVVTDTGVLQDGTVLAEDGVVSSVVRGPLSSDSPADRVVEMPDSYLAPGFVDLQVNGAFGVDVVSRPERLGRLSGALPATGVTSYLPTLITLPLERYPGLLGNIPLARGLGAEPLGLHLEGPFISQEKRGAHPAEAVAAPDPEALREMLDAARVRMVTLAPELAGAGRLIEAAVEGGAVASLGHSATSFEAAVRAFERGAASVTHLFNAMSPLHHRDPGLPGAAMSDPRARCGIVVDGHHVHPEMVRLAYERLGPDRMYLVTDAMAAAGMGEGEYDLAGSTVSMRDGVPRLRDGTLAGSLLTMDEAVRNVLDFTGCSLPEAVRMAATTPAALIGASAKGRLSPGYDADVVALSGDLRVEAAWSGGELVHGTGRVASLEKDTSSSTPITVPARREGAALDKMGVAEILHAINAEEGKVAPAVAAAMAQLEPVVRVARRALTGGGRVIYAGAGTSGRLAVSDAAECSPTFGIEPGSFVGVMAGGAEAFCEEAGEAEDDAGAGRRAMAELGVGPGDLVVGVSAGGHTPFTLAAQLEARERGADTACVVNAPGSEMARNADYPVEVITGPELLSGSTRLKAGTAQKMVLNAISTATLAGLGYVHEDLMVGMRPRNSKLMQRAVGMVRRITGCGVPEANSALERAGYDIRVAVLLVDGVGSTEEATCLLRQAGAALRPVRMALRASNSGTGAARSDVVGGDREENPMTTFEQRTTVAPKEGLHARPAAQFVSTAKQFSSEIVVIKDGQQAQAKSTLKLMTLGVKQGDGIVIRAEGEDAEAAVAALVGLVSAE